MEWGLRAGERGAATAGLGSGQGVHGVLLGCGRGAGEWQQGERREAQPPGEEEERGGLLDEGKEKGLGGFGVRGSEELSSRSMGGSSGFICEHE